MKRNLLYIALIVVAAIGFVGCSAHFEISTTSFKRAVFTDGRVAGITYVNSSPYGLWVHTGTQEFYVLPGASWTIGYHERSIFVRSGYNLHMGVVVTPPIEMAGKVRGATESWDVSCWDWNYQYNSWSTVNETVVLMELSEDGKNIVLTKR